MLVGLTAAWQSGRPAVRRNKGRFEKFWNPLLIALLGILWRFTKVQCYCSVTNVFQSFSLGKAYREACCGGTKKWDAMFFVSIPTIKYYHTGKYSEVNNVISTCKNIASVNSINGGRITNYITCASGCFVT